MPDVTIAIGEDGPYFVEGDITLTDDPLPLRTL